MWVILIHEAKVTFIPILSIYLFCLIFFVREQKEQFYEAKE